MAVVLKWRGDTFNHRLKDATAEGLQRATVFYHNACRRAVSAPNTGKSPRGGGARVYPNASQPGKPPRLRTGFGRANILQEFSKDKMAGRVGVGRKAMYMFYLEIGTRRVARRPWLMKTLQHNQERIGQLAATGGRGQIGQ